MTQGLQARNDWGWDEVHSPGTHYRPHQGVVRETHVANRKTWKQKKKGKGGGWETLEEELCEWAVTDWKELPVMKKKKRKLVNPLFSQPMNMFFFVLIVDFMWNVNYTRSSGGPIAKTGSLTVLIDYLLPSYLPHLGRSSTSPHLPPTPLSPYAYYLAGCRIWC